MGIVQMSFIPPPIASAPSCPNCSLPAMRIAVV
jgi:hypothetical protein